MRAFIFAVLVPIMAAPAWAQEAPLDKVYACAAKTDGAERLACYDGAVAALKQAGVAVVSTALIAEAEKEAFGLDAPSLAQVARSAAPAAAPKEDLDRVDVTIKTAERRPNGTYRFVLENGQVWEQIDTYDLGRTLKGPVAAVIRKASLNSFMLKPDNRTAVRVRRIR